MDGPFEVWNTTYDWMSDYAGMQTIEEAENAAKQLSMEYPKEMFSVQRIVETGGYPDRKLVSVWERGEFSYKTHRYDEEAVI